MRNGAVEVRDVLDIATTSSFTINRYSTRKIAAFSGLFSLLLLGLGIYLYPCHLPLPPVPGTFSTEKQSELTDRSRHKRVLEEKIEKRQALLQALEAKVNRIERLAEVQEEELPNLYRRISDIKGGIESDKSKLRLRGDDCAP